MVGFVGVCQVVEPTAFLIAWKRRTELSQSLVLETMQSQLSR